MILDISDISSFNQQANRTVILAMAKIQIENKRRDHQMIMRYQESKMGFEPLVFEIVGDLDPEVDRILSSLYRAGQESYGEISHILKDYLSFMLQEYIHDCL